MHVENVYGNLPRKNISDAVPLLLLAYMTKLPLFPKVCFHPEITHLYKLDGASWAVYMLLHSALLIFILWLKKWKLYKKIIYTREDYRKLKCRNILIYLKTENTFKKT